MNKTQRNTMLLIYLKEFILVYHFLAIKLCFFPQNKSLKNKLLSGNKLCGIRAEEVSDWIETILVLDFLYKPRNLVTFPPSNINASIGISKENF